MAISGFFLVKKASPTKMAALAYDITKAVTVNVSLADTVIKLPKTNNAAIAKNGLSRFL